MGNSPLTLQQLGSPPSYCHSVHPETLDDLIALSNSWGFVKGEKIYLKSPLSFEKSQYYQGETCIALYSVTGDPGEIEGHLISISHVFCIVRFQGLTPLVSRIYEHVCTILFKTKSTCKARTSLHCSEISHNMENKICQILHYLLLSILILQPSSFKINFLRRLAIFTNSVTE